MYDAYEPDLPPAVGLGATLYLDERNCDAFVIARVGPTGYRLTLAELYTYMLGEYYDKWSGGYDPEERFNHVWLQRELMTAPKSPFDRYAYRHGDGRYYVPGVTRPLQIGEARYIRLWEAD